MWDSAKGIYQELLNEINSGGLRKDERIITSPQDAVIHTKSDKAKSSHEVINFCANNYLGLSNHPELRTAAARALNEFGFGLSSVRFICGTQSLHKELEMTLSRFLHTDDTILYSSCFEANGGLFETILSERDAVISDELNHASVIDGIRLCKATRYRYRNGDMNDLEAKLKEARGARLRLIATDGVFSMDGFIADLATICQLAERYDALVMVDDSHATGFIGEHGRGTPEHCGVEGKIDVLTSTLGKALGGASGGFTTGRRLIVDLLRQRSRPYLFSNSLAPMIAAATVKALALISQSGDLRKRLRNNTDQFRLAMVKAGFEIKPGNHPIVPVMLGDARLAKVMADDLLDEGIYVIGFSYPVVPKDQARIRVQISAAHTPEHLDKAVRAFTLVGRRHRVVR